MDLPVDLYVSSLAQLLPAMVALWRRERMTRPRRWIVVWSILGFATDAVMIGIARTSGSNLWLRTLTQPLRAAVALWALSLWHTRPLPRTIILFGIVVLLPVTVVIAVFWDTSTSFGQRSGPIQHLFVMGAALGTVVINARPTTADIASSDWFWIGLGLSLYFALGVLVSPIAQALLELDQDTLRRVLIFRARSVVVAYVLLAVGMLCPVRQQEPSRGWRTGSARL